MGLVKTAAVTSKKPARQIATFQIRLPRDVLAWIDHWRLCQPIPPSRSETIRKLIERGNIGLHSQRVTIMDDREEREPEIPPTSR
jgi:hypothetical protein